MTDWVIDYAWGGPPVHEVAGKYAAVIRYLSGGGSGKDWTRAQIDAFHAAGVGVGAVWETSAGRAGGGGAAGLADGRAANAQADRLGIPRSVDLYAAVDFDAQNMGAIVDYFAAFGAAGPRWVAPYGSANTIDAVCGSNRPKIRPKGWQTVAWSRGRLSSRASMLQLVARPVPGVSGDHDDNRVIDLAAVAAWFPTGSAHQPPPADPPHVYNPKLDHGGSKMGFPHAVAACSAPNGGTWVVGLDGGVGTYGGAPFLGSYPGLPPSARQGDRVFIGIEPHGAGYRLLADTGETYDFPVNP